MTPTDVTELQRCLAEAHVDWCITGGWGIDALFGEQLREHKDLDVLVELTALHPLIELLNALGYGFALEWAESRPIPGHDDEPDFPWVSAFVMEHPEGQQIDVHVYEEVHDLIEILWDTALTFSWGDVRASGTINGVSVRCMSAEKQLECHTGYVLPDGQAEDVRRLTELVQDQL